MKRIYKKIGFIIGACVMLSCSHDPLLEVEGLIPSNDNPNSEKLPPNEHWAWVGAYPGEINNTLKRLDAVAVKVKADYVQKDLMFNSKLGCLQSSGLYVPPAEVVNVNFTGGATNLRYQVGIASWELPLGGKFSRYHSVTAPSKDNYEEGVIKSGDNKIYTNFGGHLYFYVEGEPQGGELTLTVDGAVKSSDYILGETDVHEWRTLIADSLNPMIWGELIGKRIIMTLPIKTLKQIERPDFLLEFYDEMIEKDMGMFSGVNIDDIALPLRVYSDVQLPKDVAGNDSKVYPHYPIGYVSNSIDSLDRELIELPFFTRLKNTLIPEGIAGSLAMNWSSSVFLGKNLQKIPVYQMFLRKGRWHNITPEMDVKSIPITERTIRPVEAEKESMVFQLLQEYGWELWSYISKKSREEIPVDVPDQYKNDLLAIYASEYAGVNLTEFFSDWAFPVSMYGLDYMKKYSEPTDKFWRVLSKEQPKTSTGVKGESYPKEIPERDTIYDRKDWKGTVESDDGGAHPVTNMIDSDVNTFWQTNWWAPASYPHTVDFEFEEPVEFNYIYNVQHDHQNPPPKVFLLYYKDIETGDWKEYGEEEEGTNFYLYNERNKKYHRFYLDNIIKAKGVRLVFTSTYGDASVVWANSAEFGIGLLK